MSSSVSGSGENIEGNENGLDNDGREYKSGQGIKLIVPGKPYLCLDVYHRHIFYVHNHGSSKTSVQRS